MQPSLELWIAIAAILTSPLAALLIQKYLEGLRAKEERKVLIFRALMANRANRTSLPFVQALNGIEVEFYGETKVIEAWRSLVDHLYTKVDPLTEPNITRWNDRVTDLLIELLSEMAESLGYHFDKVTIKRNTYFPVGWNTTETEQTKLRQEAGKVFAGEKPLKVEITGQHQP